MTHPRVRSSRRLAEKAPKMIGETWTVRKFDNIKGKKKFETKSRMLYSPPRGPEIRLRYAPSRL